jgi:hypothetical protein
MMEKNNYRFQVGGWLYDPERLLVRYCENTSQEYRVELAHCTTSKGMLREIRQFAANDSSTSKAIGDLFSILDALLRRRPQKEVGPLPSVRAIRRQISCRQAAGNTRLEPSLPLQPY